MDKIYKKDPPTQDKLWISLEEEITSNTISIYHLLSHFFFLVSYAHMNFFELI